MGPSLPQPRPPRLTRAPGIGGVLKSEPADFEVQEIPAYLPSGEGTHLFLHIRKQNLTTSEAANRLASALGADPKQSGWAGLKDKFAVTSQWISIAGANGQDAALLSLPNIEVLEAQLHGNKLRTGHLKGNRFCLRVRGTDALPEQALEILRGLEKHGCPNYFGEQRFGSDNLDQAMAFLDGKRTVRSKFQRKLLASVVQSAVFNSVVAERVTQGNLASAIAGDVFRKEDTGGLFQSEDGGDIEERLQAFAISPTGPMPGPKMSPATEDALALEERASEAFGLTSTRRERLFRHGPGTRRSVRFRPHDISVAAADTGIRVAFTLPKGCYATTLMREVLGDGPKRSSPQTVPGGPPGQ